MEICGSSLNLVSEDPLLVTIRALTMFWHVLETFEVLELFGILSLGCEYCSSCIPTNG